MKFRSHYGVGHEAIAVMIKDLPQQDNFVLYDLFLALSFANNYNTKEVHASNWRVCTNKVKNCVKCYFKLIQSLKSKKIKTWDKIINEIIPLHSQQMGPTKEEEEEKVMGFLTTWEHLTSGNKIKVIISSSISVCTQMEPAIHDTKLTKDSSNLNSNKQLIGLMVMILLLLNYHRTLLVQDEVILCSKPSYQ